jgi:trk system potassium uptake protein TrkA
MYIIVVGGGKVGYYLTKNLIDEGHEVLVIEKNKARVDVITEDLGSVALQGDGAEASVLSDAGASRADVMVAVTGDDEDNLVICQIAKKRFNVGRTIARINNPKNEHIFKLLGIDSTVSSTNVIMAQVEQEIPQHALVHLLNLKRSNVEIVEAVIAPDSKAVGQALKDLQLPENCIVSMIIRDGNLVIPSGNTVFEAGDEVIALTKVGDEAALRATLLQ